MRTIVLKLGGSLYDLPDLGERIATLLETFPDHRFLIFPGGGDAANLVRQWQPRFYWSDAIAHDVAIAALDFNATMLEQVIPHSSVVRTRADAERIWQTHGLPIIAPSQFLCDEERGDLPQDWTVTSDSLAAWTVLHWPAGELWFCKSVPCPTTLSAAVNDGAIDPHLAQLASRLPQLRWCNLREGSRVFVLSKETQP